MRTHTSEFKEELKVFGRQIQGKITYYPSYDLISESEDNILTEADLQIISEQANYDEPIEINAEDIFSISIIKNGDLLQSLMKEFDFETKDELNIGSVVNPQFGLLVDEDYEYLDYGNYIINSKEFNMDTETWSYVCYDKMLFSMIKYIELNNIEYPITIKQFINKLCEKIGLEFEDSEFVNQDQLINEDLYKDRNVTFRDIFDEISKIVAGNLLINDSDKLEVGYVKNTVGKNLFDLKKYYENCATSRCTKTLINDGIKINFTAGTDSWLGDAIRSIDTPSQAVKDRISNESFEIKPNTTYVLSISSAPRCYITYLDEEYNAINSNYIQIPSSYTETTYTFTTPNNAKYVLFRFGIRDNNYTEWTFSNIQLEEGSNATEYEEYSLDKINEDYLKDTNVRMSEKIGVINSVAILDSDNNLQYIAEDTQSIKENEMTRVTITDNLIAMNGETQEIANNILNKLNGLYYYANDLQTTGVCYYDFLDMFNVEARGNIYQCLLLNNEITITQGIEEHIFTEKFEEVETSSNEYTTSVMSNKQIQFNINQQEGKIESKVEKDGVISAINQSAEEIKINANKLSFEGAIIDMTADDIKIQGENLEINSDGMITLIDNSADPISLFEQMPKATYKITSEYLGIYQGNLLKFKVVNDLFANGKKNEMTINNETLDSSYTNGIQENLYMYPRTTWYSQSGDYDFMSSIGSRNDIVVEPTTGIYFYKFDNGTQTTPIIIDVNGEITCSRVIPTSRAEFKKNFEKLSNAKEILNATDIYKYNLINEKDNEKKSIGFVIGDNFNYSKEITSKENNGADLYAMVSVLWQVVKEQQEEITELKEMIKNGKY